MNLVTAVRDRLRRMWTQLRTGSGTEGMDCVALALVNLIVWASRGKLGPRSKDEVAEWVVQVRKWAGNPDRPMLIYGDAFEVLRHPELKRMFGKAGLTPPTATYLYGEPFGQVRAFLASSADRAALLPIVYGVARKDRAPMGSTTFDDAHAIVLSGAQRRRIRVGRRYVLRWKTIVLDSLFDGRRKPRSLKRYPKGPQLAQLYRYRRAAGAFGTGPDGQPRPIGFGRTVVIQVERS